MAYPPIFDTKTMAEGFMEKLLEETIRTSSPLGHRSNTMTFTEPNKKQIPPDVRDRLAQLKVMEELKLREDQQQVFRQLWDQQRHVVLQPDLKLGGLFPENTLSPKRPRIHTHPTFIATDPNTKMPRPYEITGMWMTPDMETLVFELEYFHFKFFRHEHKLLAVEGLPDAANPLLPEDAYMEGHDFLWVKSTKQVTGEGDNQKIVDGPRRVFKLTFADEGRLMPVAEENRQALRRLTQDFDTRKGESPVFLEIQE